jgi:hypothetical protein
MRPSLEVGDPRGGHQELEGEARRVVKAGEAFWLQLEVAFSGEQGQSGTTVGTMMRLRGQAQALMRMPTGDGKTTAGPTFEYVPAEHRDRAHGDGDCVGCRVFQVTTTAGACDCSGR